MVFPFCPCTSGVGFLFVLRFQARTVFGWPTHCLREVLAGSWLVGELVNKRQKCVWIGIKKVC